MSFSWVFFSKPVVTASVDAMATLNIGELSLSAALEADKSLSSKLELHQIFIKDVRTDGGILSSDRDTLSLSGEGSSAIYIGK